MVGYQPESADMNVRRSVMSSRGLANAPSYTGYPTVPSVQLSSISVETAGLFFVLRHQFLS